MNIGTLTSYTTTDFVGNRGTVTDTNDYYQFNVANSGTFNLTLNGLVGNANVELYNNSGTVITSSTQADTNSESISRVLTSGTYYVRVFPSGSGGATNYNLDLSFSADPADNAGNTLELRTILTLSLLQQSQILLTVLTLTTIIALI